MGKSRGRKSRQSKKKGHKNKKRPIKNVEKLRQEIKRKEEEETSRLEAELAKVKETEEARHKEEVTHLQDRLASFEKDKTEQDLLHDEKEKINVEFKKEQDDIEYQEHEEEVNYQKRVSIIKEIPNKHKTLVQVHVLVLKKGDSSFKRQINFKCGDSDTVDSIVQSCMQMELVPPEFQTSDCELNPSLDLYAQLDEIAKDKGEIELKITVPNKNEDEEEESPKDILFITHGEKQINENKNIVEEEDEEEEEEEKEKEEQEDGYTEAEEESEIERRVHEFYEMLKTKTMEKLWEQKNKIRSMNETEIKRLEEEFRKASKKYAHVKNFITQYQEEKKEVLERLRKKLKEKIDKMKEAFEKSDDYVQLSLLIPEEISVSYNGTRTQVRTDCITTLADIFKQVHIAFELPLSTFSYLQDNRSTPPVIITPACSARLAVLYFGSKFVQLSLRIPEEEKKSEQVKMFRDLEEQEFLDKSELLKLKVEKKEVIKVDDIPWPSFLSKVRKFEKITCFEAFNVFVDDPQDYIKQTKKKKLLWWHPDKLLWKHATLFPEHEVIILERQSDVIQALNENKDKLSEWQAETFPTN